jgi:hypothetical protein
MDEHTRIMQMLERINRKTEILGALLIGDDYAKAAEWQMACERIDRENPTREK